MNSKANYVKSQKGDGKHTCHWPGCGKLVPPAMWGCRTHWFKLPKHLRDWIWRTYMPGQEIKKNPSEEYLQAADAVQKWIKENVQPLRTGETRE